MNVYILYVLEHKTNKQNFRLSVCLVVWLYVRMYVRGFWLWTQ